MGLCYVTKDLPDKKTASEPDLWWQAIELWEPVSAYRYNTVHRELAHLCKHMNTKKHLLIFTKNAASEHSKPKRLSEGKGNSEWGCQMLKEKWSKKTRHAWDRSNGKGITRGKLQNQHWWKYVWVFVCFLPKALRLWENLGADGQLKAAPPLSAVPSPHLLFYSLSLQNVTSSLPCIFHHSKTTCPLMWAKKRKIVCK